MGDTGLTAERILEAAEEVLRRFGPEKASVVDVARVLGVTHGSVYRYFASKAALRDAVMRRWLETIIPPLEAVASQQGSAPERLHRWLNLLVAAKRKRATDDPELFAAYCALATQARQVVHAHIATLVGLAARIVADGVARGEFAPVDPTTAGRAVFLATAVFHNPVHASSWCNPDIDDALDAVWSLLESGLRTREPAMGPGPRATNGRGRNPRG